MAYLNGRDPESIQRTVYRLQGSRRREFREGLRPALSKAYSRAASVFADSASTADAQRAIQGQMAELGQVLREQYEKTGFQAANRIRKAVERRGKSRCFPGKGRIIHKQTEEEMNQLVQSWIAEHAANKITQIEDTTKMQIKRLLQRGVNENLSIPEVAKQLEDQGEEFSKYRSMMISRTETLASWNGGEIQAAKKLVPDMGKQWSSAHDSRTRDAHMDAHLQTVDMEAYFRVNGERLEHPGDPSGSAGNVINCRCVLAYVED